MIVFIISSGRGAQKSVIVGRKRLDVAIDAAIVHNEGKTGSLPIFSILGLSGLRRHIRETWFCEN